MLENNKKLERDMYSNSVKQGGAFSFLVKICKVFRFLAYKKF